MVGIRKGVNGLKQPVNGIVRKVDDLGRIVPPKGYYDALGITKKSEVVFSLESDAICIRKHSSQCVFCSERENLIDLMGKKICGGCADKAREVIEECSG